MDELQKQVNHELHELVKKLMDFIKEGDKSGEGLDLTDFVKELSTTDQKLNNLFSDAKARMKKKRW